MASAGEPAVLECEEVEEALDCMDLDDSKPAPGGTVEDEDMDEASLSRQGIGLMMNNDFKGARELFLKHRESSAVMHFGHSFMFFLESIMSFDEGALEVALKGLGETARLCQDKKTFLSSLKRKLGKKKKAKPEKGGEETLSVAEKLERRIIIADCRLYSALITMVNMDISSYVKGGWGLRKAWKIYEKTKKQISSLKEGKSVQLDTTLEEEDEQEGGGAGSMTSSRSSVSSGSTLSGDTSDLDPATLDRLHGAVCFGYGIFQLCISLTPPKVLKIIEFLGFEGDRNAGLEALRVSSKSTDMRAPLAVLGLLWYHAMVRQFFNNHGEDLRAGVPEAEALLATHLPAFPSSSLMLFFKGRTHRLKGESHLALETYNEAQRVAAGVRELELMCEFEIGWCYLMKLQWKVALDRFNILKGEARWGRAMYAYFCALCHGSLGDVKKASDVMKEVPKLVKRKNNPIEQFVTNRSQKCRKVSLTAEVCRVLTLEVIYLWNAVPLSTAEDVTKMQQVCDDLGEKKFFHVRSVVEGALYRVRDDLEMSKQCFEEAIARSDGDKGERHVTAFASFELATMLIAEKDTVEEGKKYLNKVKDMKDYEFDNRLGVRVALLVKQLKSEGRK